MGQETGIQWTDHTFNPWRGCSKISEGCKNCYAEQLVVKRQGLPVWGEHAVRKIAAESTWRNPAKWNRDAQRDGVRRRVFCASLADVFEDYRGPDMLDVMVARQRLFNLIEQTPNLDWLLLTKRPENVMQMINGAWDPRHGGAFPRNVWVGCTVENQQRADTRLPHLLSIPASVRFVSYEPALGPVCFTDLVVGREIVKPLAGLTWFPRSSGPGLTARSSAKIDWIIVGGESGPGARPFDLSWARKTVSQCIENGVPVFVKQMGARPRGTCDWYFHDEHPPEWLDKDGVLPKVSGHAAHDLCHAADDSWWPCAPKMRDRKGGDMAEWPEELRVRQVPAPHGV